MMIWRSLSLTNNAMPGSCFLICTLSRNNGSNLNLLHLAKNSYSQIPQSLSEFTPHHQKAMCTPKGYALVKFCIGKQNQPLLGKIDKKIKGITGVVMKYKVNLRKTEEGYAVWVPGLPGCWSQGQTEEEALENIKDAIQAYLETVEELSKDKQPRYVEVG